MAQEENNPHVNYFAQTDFRGRKIPFGIRSTDRSKHIYVIGKTGMGKSTMLENMAIQDIKNDEGMCFIDPHGKTAELLLEYIPPERVKDVLYIAPFDLEYPIGFNVMEDVGKDQRHLVAAGLMSAFKKIWVDAWSARMEYILNNTIMALLEYPDSTLLSINKMMSDKKFREKVVACVTDPGVRSFWVDEFANYTDRFAAEATPAIQNKVGQFTSNPLIRNIIGQKKSTFDFRQLMDEKKIVIINLSKGRIGESNANLLGSMLITKIYLAAMSRANIADEAVGKLPSFYLYVDEFQSFANESFADILSEARKYKLSLTIAHQYIEQMVEEVRNAVFGNVGTTIAFRVGPFDAEVLEKIFFPTFTKEDIVNLGFTQIYLSLMIDGIGSKPFSAVTLPPIPVVADSLAAEVIAHSREKYAMAKDKVEAEIFSLHNQGGETSGQNDKARNDNNRNTQRDNNQNRDNNRNNKSSDRNLNFQKDNFNNQSNRPRTQSNNGQSKESNNLPNKNRIEDRPRQKPEPDKSFSLATLNGKKDKNDKGTGKHREDLRSALAELINSKDTPSDNKDGNKDQKVSEAKRKNYDDNKTGQNSQNKEDKKNNQDEKSSQSNNQRSSADQSKSSTPKHQETPMSKTVEVPEEVLRSMLKVDGN